MTMKKTLAAGAISTLALSLTACGGDADGEGEASTTASTTTAAAGPISEAGGDYAIHGVAAQAVNYCHTETTFDGTSIDDSEYAPDEFAGVYVEDGGRTLRYVVLGTVRVPNGEGTREVGYSCGYLQSQGKSRDTVKDDLGILNEGEAIAIEDGGSLYRGLRDHLREYHGTSAGDGPEIYDEAYEDARGGWQDQVDAITPLLPDSSSGSSSSSIKDGTHLVGSDIQPGTYRNDGTSSCYWARLSGTGGTVEDIIANDNPRGQAYVTIDPSDIAFESKNCGSWELVE